MQGKNQFSPGGYLWHAGKLITLTTFLPYVKKRKKEINKTTFSRSFYNSFEGCQRQVCFTIKTRTIKVATLKFMSTFPTILLFFVFCLPLYFLTFYCHTFPGTVGFLNDSERHWNLWRFSQARDSSRGRKVVSLKRIHRPLCSRSLASLFSRSLSNFRAVPTDREPGTGYNFFVNL